MAPMLPVLADPPSNDNFADAIDLGSQAPVTSTSTNADATQEPGERKPPYGRADGDSIWWKWTAPTDGIYAIDTLGSELLDTMLAVYTGTQVDDLDMEEDNNDIGGGEYRSRVMLEARAGTVYHIQVMGAGGAGRGITLNIAQPPVPPNDAFAAATNLGSAATVTAEGSLLQATLEPGESDISYTFALTASVWFKWTAPASGVVEVNTTGTNYSVGLGVFQGTSLATLAKGTWQRSSRPAQIVFPVTAGQTYHLQVLGRNDQTDPLKLEIKPAPAGPTNDLFAAAADLGSAASVTVEATTAGATDEIGEPLPDNNANNRLSEKSVWWKWTAPAGGAYEISALGEGVNTVLAVYTGSALDALTMVIADTYAGDPDGYGQVRLVATAGQTYYLQVANRSGNRPAGAFTLAVQPGAAAAPNDAFAAAIDLGNAATVTAEGNNRDATTEEGEAFVGAGGASVWWRWTAPATGPVEINTLGSEIDTLLAVYTGNSLPSLSLVTANYDALFTAGNDEEEDDIPQSLVRLHAIAGTTYHVQILGERDDGQPAIGAIKLEVKPVATPPAGDLFAGAVALGSALPQTVTADSTLATIEAGEPLPSSARSIYGHFMWQPHASLWWKWTAPADGWVGINVDGAETEDGASHYMGVYTGSTFADLEEVGDTRFQARAQTTYYIQALPSNHQRAEGNPFTLILSPLPDPPANDNLADATPLGNAADLTVAGTLANASSELSDPLVREAQWRPSHSVWWTWTAPATGWVNLTLVEQASPTIVSAYVRRPGAASLSPLGSESFQAIAGSTYYILAYEGNDEEGNPTSPGAFRFRISPGTGELTGYAAWVAARPGWTGAQQNTQADPDGDGLPNGLEYTLGLDPTRPDATPWLLETTQHEGATYAALRLTLPASRAGSLPRLVVEQSADLVTWTLAAEEFESGGWYPGERWTENDAVHIRVRAAHPLSADGATYFRVGTVIVR